MRLIDADELRTAFPAGERIRTESVRSTIDHMPAIKLEQKQDKWILCSEKPPKDSEIVFVYLFGNSPYLAWRDDGEWRTEDFTVDKCHEPVAWLPLPKPYREEL